MRLDSVATALGLLVVGVAGLGLETQKAPYTAQFKNVVPFPSNADIGIKHVRLKFESGHKQEKLNSNGIRTVNYNRI